MNRDLSRLLRPRSVALFGGGWAANVIAQLQKSGFAGDIWPVSASRDEISGIRCYPAISALPGAPDAAFVGVNREATIGVIRTLREMGAGGAICFASGFRESENENTGGADLQAKLVAAAGEMPVLGPNCYGLINYLDNAPLWPDQHGGVPVGRGVAIIAQSSNIAINMTMQHRSLPIAYVVTAGNQAQTGIGDIAAALAADQRVSAIGLYLESFGDIRSFEAFAAMAHELGKPVVALKTGRSDKAKAASLTHTASLSGNAAASSALLRRLGIAEVNSIAVFLETLKLLHVTGPLAGDAICSVSCSGGEASLMADLAPLAKMQFRDFSDTARYALKRELGPLVTIANPLDYHTYVWGDTARMTSVFAEVMKDNFDLTVFVLDIPRTDRCDPSGYQCAIDAIMEARRMTGARVAVLSSLPENLPETLSEKFIAAGIVPLHGMEEGLAAIDSAIAAGRLEVPSPKPVLFAGPAGNATVILTEAQAKAALAECGLAVPRSVQTETATGIAEAASALNYPLALKGLGIAHKSEAGAVVLNIKSPDELLAAAEHMRPPARGFLAEEMALGGVAEILAGVTRDATGMLVLTLGAGGVMAEQLADTQCLILPVERHEVERALQTLKISKLLAGWRGGPAANIHALTGAIMAVCRYAEANARQLLELDVNPLIARAGDAIAVDALIRLSREEMP